MEVGLVGFIVRGAVYYLGLLKACLGTLPIYSTFTCESC